MKNPTKKIFVTVIILTVISFASKGLTPVSGGIYSNTTWTVSGSPYIIMDTVVVFPGVTLTIQPGVIVKFNNGKRLEIRQGTITAQGTSTDSIIFTSNSSTPSTGIWNDIYLNGDGNAHTASFNYCNFKYAHWGIQSNYYTLTINNSKFSNNTIAIGYSFGFTFDGFSLHMTSCYFKNNPTGITGYNADVFLNSCNVFNSITAINADALDLYFTDCRFSFNTTGIHNNGGYASLKSCKVTNNQTGIDFNNLAPSVKNCTIDSNTTVGLYCQLGMTDSIVKCKFRYNGIGFHSAYTIDPNIVTNNYFENNNIGIKLVGTNADYISCNMFCNNTSYDLLFNLTSNASFPYNYWCTMDSATIETHIYDGYDNVNYGLVSFMPLDTTGCHLVITDISNNEIENNSLQIFPNPANDNLTVRLFQDKLKGEIQIFNLLGQQYPALTISSHETTIDVSYLSKGVYIINLTMDKNIYRQKFIKQ